jgi:assimilatory nitrate reductase catalytic subunit
MSVVRTTCPYCGVGCGIVARAAAAEFEITGDPQHPANSGHLCSKGAALAETLSTKGRLLYPQIRGRRVPWDQALNRVSAGFTRTVAEHGPDAVAFYVSGQLLSEDYYVANKLMKGFIGSANIDTNSRLCMASAVVAHQRAFGEDLVPGCYEDFDCADLVVLVGSNTAWCHPVLFQRLVEARERRPDLKIVAIDPRRTPTCEIADLHLPVRSGTDVWLFNGLLSYLHINGLADAAFVYEHTQGLSTALAAADSCKDPAAVARVCGIDAGRTLEFFRLFAATSKVVTAFSQGVNQSSAGTDKANAIINCHLLTGRLGLPGAGPFSLTGQPNAMGGREVGGMATTLAAHLSLKCARHRELVQGFWEAPHIASRQGLKAVDLFEAIHERRVKAVWIMATNPVVSLPDADRVRAALARCPLVVVSDCVARTDTTVFAHLLLPAAAWGEKDGTVTNSERRISRQRPFRTTPGEARPDWWIVSEVARRMGFSGAFPYRSPHEIFTEHARLSGAGNGGSRVFDISGLAKLTAEQYDELTPVQWPVPTVGHAGTARLFADRRFSHRDGRAHFVATVPRGPAHGCDDEYPWVLNTGRIRDQWHTMTRTGISPRLSEHRCEPFVDLHAQDALLAGVRTGELARVTTSWGSLVARVRTGGEMARRAAFVPIHWSAANSSEARVGAVVSPAVDPISGEPEFKHTPVRVEPFVVDWYGFIVSRRPLAELNVTWWTRVQGAGVTRYEVAGRGVPPDWPTWARALIGATDSNADYLEYSDVAAGSYRAAYLTEDRLEAYVCVARRPDLPERAWLAELFSRDRLGEGDRMSLLAGRAFGKTKNVGALVCSCFGVGRNELVRAIRQGRLTDAHRIGLTLKAGTGCGSCLPEIKSLIGATAHESSPLEGACPPES